ncbi:hypothetical protein MVEG_01481 [Podila verticillata NRRL 6337]|nr:hypothetical protein MVEG_01481 [Podila verticillata NRRL 6337]
MSNLSISYSLSNWDEEVARISFGGLPVLRVTGMSGKDAVISEAVMIETCLAKRYGLLGDGIYQETVTEALHSTILSMYDQFSIAVTFIQPESCIKFIDISSTLLTFCALLEKHLVVNDSNGRFIGSKLSLVDIRTARLIEHITQQPCAYEPWKSSGIPGLVPDVGVS